MNVKTLITDKLEDRVKDQYGCAANVVAIASPEEAEFYGLLLESALQDSSFLKAVEDERLLVWAIVVDGRIYVAGAGYDDYGRVAQFQCVLGFRNDRDDTAFELNDIFVGVLASVNRC